ncbi:MAG: site-specific integrase [Fermentimonas sp.]|jgi:integrase
MGKITRKKTKPSLKEPVRIRFKELKNGNSSIYLDFYSNGKRWYEFLKLYLIPESNKKDKERNKTTLELAKAIQSKRIVDLQNNEHGFKPKKVSRANLLDYVDKIAEKHLNKTGNKHGEYYNFKSLKLHLSKYAGKKIQFRNVDEKFARGFIEYLKTAENQNLHKNKKTQYLSQNSQNKLYRKLNTTLKQAVRERIIPENPFDHIDKDEKPKAEPGSREYLTIEEIIKLINTDCTNEHVKRSFLFCCLTGLRFSDVSRLTWENVQKNNSGGYELKFQMQKVKKPVIIQISNEAVKFLPERTKPTDRIFKLSKNEIVNPVLADWVKAAKINKNITFHCSRHTAATLNLSLGVPVAVVSKLMGHSKIATTEIYAKIVDEAQRSAVDKQDGIFDINEK